MLWFFDGNADGDENLVRGFFSSKNAVADNNATTTIPAAAEMEVIGNVGTVRAGIGAASAGTLAAGEDISLACQTNSTCVLCDACFRESDQDGHEVFFHRRKGRMRRR